MSGGGKATLVAVLLILLIPIPVHSTKENDNSTEYKALLYTVTDVQRERRGYAEDPYEEGIIIKVLGKEIYNNVG